MKTKIKVEIVIPNKKEKAEIDKIIKSVESDKRPLSERKYKVIRKKG